MEISCPVFNDLFKRFPGLVKDGIMTVQIKKLKDKEFEVGIFTPSPCEKCLKK